MSASEKLKALEPIHLTVRAEAGGPYPAPDPLAEMTVYDLPLPQIVAVVEAAEALATLPEESILAGEPWNVLDSALAALDEALS